MATEVSTTDVLTVLRASHDRLTAALGRLSEDELSGQSYDDDWSIAQVASHLGSGGELFGLFLDAGLTGDDLPGPEMMQPVWARWDAKPPADQARDALVADEGFLDRAARFSEDEQDRWRLDIFGSERTLADFLQMRLAEHALHTWDITVLTDPALGVPEDAAALIVDNVGTIAGYTGKAPDQPLSVAVRTTDPARSLVLRLGPDAVGVESEGAAADAELALPAEAFIRLVYGRLDADHTPESVTATGVDLDRLREVFSGV